MNNIYNNLINALRKDDRLVVDNKLVKNKVIELALQLDSDLIKSLRSSNDLEKTFFQKVDDVLVFDKVKFQSFVSNKQFLPDSFTEYKNRIGLVTDKQYLTDNKDVVLAFPYKDCVLEGGQTKEDVKRNEVFWNETLAPDEIDKLLEPKVFTNFKKYDAKGEHSVAEFSTTENLIIKGNNLLALHSLKKTHKGKIKLIYIDPPYNTGSDSFLYNDNFNHSSWLVFMRNRLEIAKTLLAEDGVICVQADDSEQPYLKVLLDEIFNRKHLSTFYIQVRYPDKQLAKAMTFHKLIETVHIYSKTEKPKLYQKSDAYDFSKYCFEIKEIKKPSKKIKLGAYDVEVFDAKSYEIVKSEKPGNHLLKEIWASGKILDSSSTGRFFRDYLDGRFSEDGLGVLYKVYGIGEGSSGFRYITGPQKEGATRGKYYQEVPAGRLDGTKQDDLRAIENYFDYAGYFGNCRHEGGVPFRSGKKPEILIKDIIEFTTTEEDIVLDFHLGSGTTCAVAHKMSRKYIGIEQLDYGTSDSVQRLKNVIDGDKTGISEEFNWKGGGSFTYAELAQANQLFVNKIQDSKNTKELLKVWDKMKEIAFLSYKIKPEEIDSSKKDFEALSFKDQQRFFVSILDKNLLYVPYSEIDDKTYSISKEDKELNKKFYGDK